MNLVIRGVNMNLSPALRSHVERRLAFALERFAQHIRLVQVRLSHGSGHRQGNEERCRIEARMRSLAPVMVEVADEDIYSAVDRAADRLGFMLAREVARARTSVRVLASAG
jgi:putative sigma-54 modulation protein